MIKKNPQILSRALAIAFACGAALVAPAASASSHREAPAISNDPCADNTDVWAWVKPGTHDKLFIVASYIPLEEPSGGPNFYKFCDDVLYQVHIARGYQSLADAVTYSIKFNTTPPPRADVADLNAKPGGGKEFFSQLSLAAQTYTVTRTDAKGSTEVASKVPVAPINYGPRTQTLANQLGLFSSSNYDDAFAATFIKPTSDGGRVWAGPRDDGFYVDLGGIFDLANLRPKSASSGPVAQDGLAGFNTHSIVLEIPTATLAADGATPTAPNVEGNTIGIWASASRKKVSVLRKDGTTSGYGPWVQVSRLGLPLINEAVIGIQDKDKFNRTTPATDVQNFGAYFLNPIIVRDAEAVGIYSALGVDPTPFKSNRTDIIAAINLGRNIPLTSTGDVLRVDMGMDSKFPNGRMVGGGAAPNQDQVNVTHALLSLLLTKGTAPVSDNVDSNDKAYLGDVPFLPLPWRGFDEGHGKPTNP